MEKLAKIIQRMWRKQDYVTVDDIRSIFGDYHNALRWLASFLVQDEELAEACIVDACTIAEAQKPTFHEWLIHWAALATLRCAFHREERRIAELALQYEQCKPVEQEQAPLSTKHLRQLIEYSGRIGTQLDVLCRFVLVMRGIAKESPDEVAAKLRIGRNAVERAYGVALEALN